MSRFDDNDDAFLQRFERNLSLEPTPQWAKPAPARDWQLILGGGVILAVALAYSAPWARVLVDRLALYSHEKLGLSFTAALVALAIIGVLGWLAYDEFAEDLQNEI